MTAAVLHLKKTDNSHKGAEKATAHHTNTGRMRRNRPNFDKKPGNGFHKEPRDKMTASAATGSPARAAAAMAVAAVENGRSLTKTLPKFLKDMDGRDRALVQEIVYGTLRHRRLLSERLKGLLEHSIVKRFENSRALLLCALYQIVYTRIPAHAVVASTVGACASCGCRNMTGLVNAVLRRFLREGASLNEDQVSDDVRYSVPQWLYDKLCTQYPDQVLEILKAQNEHAPVWLRVENSKISTADYQAQLKKNEIEASAFEYAHAALKLKQAVGTEDMPRFQQGMVSVQDLAAQMAAPLLEPKAGEKILDCCAAPGGKSAHLLDLCPEIELISADADEERLAQAQKNFVRLGRNPHCVVCDFASAEAPKQLGNDFDKILLDAPCSGTGVIRRHPDIKWLRREKDIDNLKTVQAAMLDQALKMLKVGGILVYTTCSILKEENEEQVKAFLERHADEVEALPFDFCGQNIAYKQSLPGENSGDGFFYARFVKKA